MSGPIADQHQDGSVYVEVDQLVRAGIPRDIMSRCYEQNESQGQLPLVKVMNLIVVLMLVSPYAPGLRPCSHAHGPLQP